MDLHSGFKDTFKNNTCKDSCPCIQRNLLALGDKQTKHTSQKWTHFTKKNIQIVNSHRKECLIKITKSSGNTNFSLNKILAAFSDLAVTTFGVYFKLQSFVFMPIFGMNNASVPIIAYNYGADRRDRLEKAMSIGVRYGIGVMSVGTLIF